MSDFFKFLGDVTVYVSLALGLIYFIGFVRNNRAYKLFTVYLFLVSIIQLIALYIGRWGLGESNLYMAHFYYLSQFILLSFFYFELLKKPIIKVILFIVLLFIAYQFFQDPNIFFHYNPLAMTITQGSLVVYSILYLYKTLKGKSEFIIVNIGLLIYLLSSTLIFASGNLVLDLDIPEETKFTLINVNRILTIVFQILIFIEWWRNYRTKISKN